MAFKVTDKQQAIRQIEEFLCTQSVYMGPPSFAYRIGEVDIDRNGNVMAPSEMEHDLKMALLGNREVIEHVKVDAGEQMTAGQLRNLLNMIHSKQHLLERSLGYEVFHIPDEVIVSVNKKNIGYDRMCEMLSQCIGISAEGIGIVLTGLPAGECFERLANRMIGYCKEKMYILPDETLAENEKYFMRAWLVRIGLGGNEGKELRQVLLKNLKGHTAFRTDDDAKRWKEKHADRHHREKG